MKDEQLDRLLTDLYPQSDPPREFQTAWRGAIRREEQLHMKKNPFRFWRVAIPALAALVLVVGALSVGANRRTDRQALLNQAASTQMARSATGGESVTNDFSGAVESGEERSYFSADSAAAAPLAKSDTSAATVADSRKIVRTAELSIATGAFEESDRQLRALVEKQGGYIEYASISGDASKNQIRKARYTLRIPTASLDDFLSGAAGIGRVTAKAETAEDKTAEYSDTSLRLQTQQEKMKRLQEMMAKAESVSELVELESAIADTQYLLDSYESSIRDIDRQVDNSTVELSITEETTRDLATVPELSLWQRIQNGFSASLEWLGEFGQDLLVFIVMCLPVLIPLTAVCAVVVILVRRRNHKRKEEQKS